MARLIWKAPAGVAYTQFNKLRGFAHMLQMHRRLSKFIQFRQTRWLSDSVTLHSGICFEAMIPPKDLGKPKIGRQESLSFQNLWGPVLISGIVLLSELSGFAGSSSEFEVAFDGNALASLKPRREGAAEYIQGGQRLGDLFARWREPGQQDWRSFTNAVSNPFTLDSTFTLQQHAILLTIHIQNVSNQRIEIGDLALPLPISRSGSNRSVILK